MKKMLICAAIFYSLGFAGLAEAQDLQHTLPADAREMLLLSLSTDDYPVTPGDIYRLTYIPADVPISLDVVVESDFTVNLS